MDESTREFMIESQERLDRMERCLTDLEKRPDDAALIAEILPSVHTIKGTTGFLRIQMPRKTCPRKRKPIGLLRDGSIQADAAVVGPFGLT